MTKGGHTGDFENLSEFSIEGANSQHPVRSRRRTVAQAAKKQRSKNSELDRLIEEDAKNALLTRSIQHTPSTHGQGNRGEVARSDHGVASSHILDMRKQYLIQKNRLHEFEQPRGTSSETIRLIASSIKDRVRSFSAIEWRAPAREHVQPESPVQRVGRGASYIVSYGLLTAFVVLLVPALGSFLTTHNAVSTLYAQARSAFSNLYTGALNYAQDEHEASLQNLEQANADFSSLHKSLTDYTSVLQGALQQAPFSRPLYELAESATHLGETLSQLLVVLVSQTEAASATNQVSSENLLPVLTEIEPLLQSIENDLTHITESLSEGTANEIIPYIGISAEELGETAHALLRDVAHVRVLTETAHHVLGGTSPTRVLFLFQNSHELRPTGGFIGSYAAVDFQKGRVTSVEFPSGGTYDLTAGMQRHLTPPGPLSIVNREWFLWDANWWADYPRSARKVAQFYEQATGRTVDAVIAINSDVLERILAVTGPLSVPQYPSASITAENVYTMLQEYIEHDYAASGVKPKAILKDLAPVLFENFMKQASMLDIVTLFTEQVSQKNIQVYLFDEKKQANLSAAGLDGSLRETPKDYLMVVSTNIAGGKSDAAIYQTTLHEVALSASGSLRVTTTVTKDHRAISSDPFSYVPNLDFIRFYVPAGSTYIDSRGFYNPPEDVFRKPEHYQVEDSELAKDLQALKTHPDRTIEYQENGKTVFGNWMHVEPGSQATASITYELPFTMKTGAGKLPFSYSDAIDSYSLYTQKQAGKKNEIITSRFTVPDDMRIVWSGTLDNESITIDAQSATMNNTFLRDMYYAVLVALEKDAH